MPSAIIAETLRHILEEQSTCAVLDVREHGEYNAAHIPGATSLPRRLIEFRLRRLVPSTAVQIVVCDDDERRAWPAARTIERLGYERVAVLDGGVNRWAWLGFPTEWGMNVLGKDFGEKIQVQHDVPTIEAHELERRLKSSVKVVVLDVRTDEEYQKGSIPGALCAPGGELPLHVAELLRAVPDATVVLTCAGRPRSILATRLLQRMGFRNVLGLRNGTSGWALSGLPLQKNGSRCELLSPTADTLTEVTSAAVRIAKEDGVRFIGADELARRIAQPNGCAYYVDVRSEQEYGAGHIPGFSWFPGGQAILLADDVVAVRNATITFCCDSIVRSAIVASWYRQIGFSNVMAVKGGTAAWVASGHALEPGLPDDTPAPIAGEVRWKVLSPPELRQRLDEEPPLVVFVDRSNEFASGHVPGSRWILRSWLDVRIPEVAPDKSRAIVVTDSNGRSAPLAASMLTELGYGNIAVLEGGVAGWRAANLPVEQGLSGIMTPPDDVVPTGADRPYHEMINYLRWEEALGHKYQQPQHTLL